MEKTAGVRTTRRSPVFGIFQLDFLELFSARHFANLGVQRISMFSRASHSARKIVDIFEMIVAANDEQHFGGALGKEHRGLARRVAAAGDNHRFAATKLTFQRGGCVINANAFKLFAALGLQPAIVRAGRDQDSFRSQHRPDSLRSQGRRDIRRRHRSAVRAPRPGWRISRRTGRPEVERARSNRRR